MKITKHDQAVIEALAEANEEMERRELLKEMFPFGSPAMWANRLRSLPKRFPGIPLGALAPHLRTILQ